MSRLSSVQFTPEGMARIAAIVREARGELSYVKFQHKTGVSHATLWKIEMWGKPDSEPIMREVKLSTLAALAQPVTSYTVDQLLAIARGDTETQPLTTESITMAEDLLESINKLPPREFIRLISIALDRMQFSPQDLKQLLNIVTRKISQLIDRILESDQN